MCQVCVFEYFVTVSEVTLGVEINGNGYFGIRTQLQDTMRSNKVNRG